jgi:hypothetical protein
MDIMSAIFVFVPLLAPMAIAVGVDPIHFGIIFIVNLEIGYLTPPVGLNLFVASTLFNKPVGHITKSVLPFVGFMLIGLMIVTYVPEITLIGSRWFAGAAQPRTSTMEEMMQQVDDEAPGAVAPSGGDGGAARQMTPEELMAEMMRQADEAAAEVDAGTQAADPPDAGSPAP